MTDAIGDAIRSAMMHSTAAMVLSDPNLPDCPMVAVNPAFTAVTGYAADAAVGRNCRFLQGAGTDPETPKRIRACLAAGRGCVEWIVNHRRDGSPFWNLLFLSPIRDAEGGLRYFFGHQLDITFGIPAWFGEVSMGPADIPPSLEAEFRAVLGEAGEAARARALDRIVATAHRLAELSVRLAPGTLDDARGRFPVSPSPGRPPAPPGSIA